MTQSESAVAAVPGAADSWTSLNAFTVPAGVRRLKRVKVGQAPDPGALAQMHVTPLVRLTGSGLLEQNPHIFAAQAIDLSIVAGGSGGGVVEPEVWAYEVDIPVATGGVIQVDFICLSEVPAAMTMRCELDYDAVDPTATNQMSDAVSTSTLPGAADAWATVGTLTVPQVLPEKSPKRIREIVCGLNPDEAGNTLIRGSTRFRLSGAGIAEGGLHHLLGSQKGVMWTTPGAQAVGRALVRHKDVDIPVNPGGQILVEMITDVELPAAGTYVFAVLYE